MISSEVGDVKTSRKDIKMSNYLKRKIAEQAADDRLAELCRTPEEEECDIIAGGISQQIIDALDAKEEKEASKEKEVVVRTYMRTGSDPNAGMDQIMKAKRARRRAGR